MLKAKELHNQSIEDLELLDQDLLKEIFELTNELRITRKLEKPHSLKSKKKDRAKVLTVLTQKREQKNKD